PVGRFIARLPLGAACSIGWTRALSRLPGRCAQPLPIGRRRDTWAPMHRRKDAAEATARAQQEATEVLDGLRRIVQGLRQSSHAAERKLGVSGAQLFVLSELADAPGSSIRALSERTLTDPSSVSVVISRLVEAGLVTRRRAEEDARRNVLEVTAAWRLLLARAPEPYQARLITALRAMPASQRRQFGRALAIL